jgi:hypothetical protein
MSAASLRAGTMTVIEGEPAGEMLCLGISRLGTRGRPKAASITFQSQVSAINQAMSSRASCRGWLNRFAATSMLLGLLGSCRRARETLVGNGSEDKASQPSFYGIGFRVQ